MTAEKTRAKAKPARKRTSKATEPTLYKVLVRGQSCHGGSLTWSLPTADGPGAWHEVDGALDLCHRGLHVTRGPDVVAWIARAIERGAPFAALEIYECETGDERTDYSTSENLGKLAARRVRLLRRVTDHAELATLGIYLSGDHVVTEGRGYASGSASVTASGSASVTASGSASVTASGSASVTAYDSARVTASGSASVTAYDSARVTAYDSARVTASDSARVTAYDSASVTAYGSASVRASGSASVIRWTTAARVSTSGAAVLVDRSAGYSAPATAYTTPHNTHPEAT